MSDFFRVDAIVLVLTAVDQVLVLRGVLVTLPAQFAQMLPKNPKGLNGSIKPVEPMAAGACRCQYQMLGAAATAHFFH